MDKLSVEDDSPPQPSPTDFDNFLPWACSQLAVEVDIIITRKLLSEYVSAVASDRTKLKTKSKIKPIQLISTDNYSSSTSSGYQTAASFAMNMTRGNTISIETIYDNSSNLLQIKFLQNKTIPRQVLSIIGLIIPFHTYLHSISINSGLHVGTLYELSRLLPISKITEIYLDRTFLCEANYHILLGQNDLKLLSLSKCKINDAVVKTIATKLTCPCPASKTLAVLNLSTNRITDLGANYLADVLRTNRHLSYLNLADNLISDRGAISILSSLGEFFLTETELKGSRIRHLTYLKDKTELICKTFKELQAGEFERKAVRRKSVKPFVSPVPKRANQPDVVAGQSTKSVPNMNVIFQERAAIIAENLMGRFRDPFSPHNTVIRDSIPYCYGNNTLCYLNLAYNNLSYFSIKKLYEVLVMQTRNNRRPKGLINVVVEGNYLPDSCTELQYIDELLEAGLVNIRKMSLFTKNKLTKAGSR